MFFRNALKLLGLITLMACVACVVNYFTFLFIKKQMMPTAQVDPGNVSSTDGWTLHRKIGEAHDLGWEFGELNGKDTVVAKDGHSVKFSRQADTLAEAIRIRDSYPNLV